MAIKNLFVKDTRVLITWEERFAKIQLVYNDIMAPFKTIIEHWENFQTIAQYFNDDNASYAIIQPSKFAEVMQKLDALKEEYGINKKMAFIYDDKVQNIQVLDTPPSDYIVKYVREGSGLKRIIPEDSFESEDGWDVWQNKLWNYPSLQNDGLKTMRRNAITSDELIHFFNDLLPTYRKTGLKIECELNLKEENAVEIEIGKVERDNVEFDIKWSVPLDSIDPEFDFFGFVLSGNTIYSGLNPLELEEYFQDLVGKHILKNQEIAKFHDKVYEKWSPWINGDRETFDEMHQWLEPPYSTFIKVEITEENGIGSTTAKPYLLINNECLSSEIINDIVIHSSVQRYYHLREGWIRVEQLEKEIDPSIIATPTTSMQTFELSTEQILHLGDKQLSEKWQDILPPDRLGWTDGGPKASGRVKTHLDYLAHWGIDGGLSGGYESFMAFGMPYVLDFIMKNKGIKPLFLADTEYITQLKTIILNIIPFTEAGAEVVAYNELTDKNKHDDCELAVLVEPETIIAPTLQNHIMDIMDNAKLNLCFFISRPSKMNAERQQQVANLLCVKDINNLQYIIRSAYETIDAPAEQKYPKNLHLKQRPLIYHEKELDLQ